MTDQMKELSASLGWSEAEASDPYHWVQSHITFLKRELTRLRILLSNQATSAHDYAVAVGYSSTLDMKTSIKTQIRSIELDLIEADRHDL